MSERPFSLRCPACSAGLAWPQAEAAELACPGCKARYPVWQGVPLLLPPDLPADMVQSIAAWNQQWAAYTGAALKEHDEEYDRDYMADTTRQLLSHIDPAVHRRYLEVGCGPGFLGAELAKRGFEVAGVDCCINAIKVATGLYASKGVKGHFVGGDLHHIPLADGSVDFLYGGGVIEHFKDTLGAVKELHRVLAPGGVSFNTVPYASIGSYTYRQKHGNVPDVPLVRPFLEWVHIDLLKGRHMAFGYEKSFTARNIAAIHRQAGFSQVEVRLFEVFLPLGFIPRPLQPLARWLCQFRPFWPMIAVIAKK